MENLEKITSPIFYELSEFEKKLSDVISRTPLLQDDLRTFLFKNPKRLRVIFIYLFSKILDIKEKNMILNIALASELIHSASLIHDDIIDCDIQRRNNPTFYKKFGSKIALLEGDLLLSLALKILSDTNYKIIKIYSKKIENTINGEILQNININKIPDEKEYLKKTCAKTANLFLAGLESLFTLKEFDENLKYNLIEFQKNYAIAFQIQNDIKDIKSDIKNGNYTLAVIYYNMEEKIKDINKISELDLKKYLERAALKAQEYKNKALSYIKDLREDEYKKALVALVEQI